MVGAWAQHWEATEPSQEDSQDDSAPHPWRRNVDDPGIATQMGWSEGPVEKLLAVYGRKEILALREIDALYESSPDAIPTQSRSNPAF